MLLATTRKAAESKGEQNYRLRKLRGCTHADGAGGCKPEEADGQMDAPALKEAHACCGWKYDEDDGNK